MNLKFFLTNNQIRGTPGSGKSELTRLLCQHILQQEPTTSVIWVQGWSRDEIDAKGGWIKYFETEKGWIQGENTVFVFDEAQMSYDDGDLWHNLFKSIHTHPNRCAIIFASYGSATSHFKIAGTPLVVTDVQRVTLRAIQHEDMLPPVGLFFTQTEMDDLVSMLYPSQNYSFHASFFTRLFDLTQGHVGAIIDFIHIILAHSVGPSH
jgi:hypothetical protein